MSFMEFLPKVIGLRLLVLYREPGEQLRPASGARERTLLMRHLQTGLLVIALPGWYKARPGNRWGPLLDSKSLKSLKVSVCPAFARSPARSRGWGTESPTPTTRSAGGFCPTCTRSVSGSRRRSAG